MDEFHKGGRIRVLGAFAMALRQGRFSGPAYDTLVESTVRSTISFVSQKFREDDRPNPTKDEDGELGRLLSRLFRAFKNEDPNPKQQKALPIGVLRELAKLQVTESQKAITQLAIGAIFFAMRSCEYLSAPQAEKKRTAVLKLKNIRFNKDHRTLSHDSPLLEFADSVSITFEFQKKDERNDTVSQMFTGDPLLCPVRSWAAIVRRIWSYPGASLETPVSAVWRDDKIDHISSKELIARLRASVIAIGEDRLGFKADDIGTHSIRSGGAMQMFLGESPVYVIMMIGRWSSDAFLRYIRKQVEMFSHNVSRRMLRYEIYWHVPNYEPSTSRFDPRQRNHPENAKTRRNVGGDSSRRSCLPAFSIFN